MPKPRNAGWTAPVAIEANIVAGTARIGDSSSLSSRARPFAMAVIMGPATVAYPSARPDQPCEIAFSPVASSENMIHSTFANFGLAFARRLKPYFLDEPLVPLD